MQNVQKNPLRIIFYKTVLNSKINCIPHHLKINKHSKSYSKKVAGLSIFEKLLIAARNRMCNKKKFC